MHPSLWGVKKWKLLPPIEKWGFQSRTCIPKCYKVILDTLSSKKYVSNHYFMFLSIFSPFKTKTDCFNWNISTLCYFMVFSYNARNILFSKKIVKIDFPRIDKSDMAWGNSKTLNELFKSLKSMSQLKNSWSLVGAKFHMKSAFWLYKPTQGCFQPIFKSDRLFQKNRKNWFSSHR